MIKITMSVLFVFFSSFLIGQQDTINTDIDTCQKEISQYIKDVIIDTTIISKNDTLNLNDSYVVSKDTLIIGLYIIDSMGNKELIVPQLFKYNNESYIILTENDAQTLNNAYDMVIVLNEIVKEYGIVENINLQIVNNYEKKIENLNLQIDKDSQLLVIKEKEIEQLKNLISKQNQEIENLNRLNELSSEENSLLIEQRDEYKKQRDWIAGTSAVIITIISILAIF